MLELLAPAGSPEAVTAAVQSGADAVYFGYGDYNARRNAKNFTPEQAAQAISYCHLRGAKVYITLNTLLTDRELPQAAQLAAQVSELGADAILVQDLGVARMLRQTVPDVPLHGSTQMSVHSLDGVKMAAELGLKRVVLARELSAQALSYICAHTPIEVEVFVHGALCMCYSGQCFFSSVLGGRSGNRGLCAQPCRLKYGWGRVADGYPLSLKDLSLASHLSQLRRMGVACVKIEGRMKRPEYVAVVTEIYARLIRENREPIPQEQEQLLAAFSRQGFTDGYFTGQVGPAMFGVREQEREPKELFAQARARCGRENPRVPVTFYALIQKGESAKVGVEDDRGNLVTVEGPPPEDARTKELTCRDVQVQLAKTGGTPYRCQQAKAYVESGLSLSAASLNALRRQALDELSSLRVQPPQRRQAPFQPGVRYAGRRQAPEITLSLSHVSQLSQQLLEAAPALIYLPLDQAAEQPGAVKDCLSAGVPVAVTLPRIAWDNEKKKLSRQLEQVRLLGVTEALVGTLGLVRPVRDAGMNLRGDFGLGVMNSQTLKELKRMGFLSATVSFECRLSQIRDLSKPLSLEMLVYGRLPLMLTEHCIIENHLGACGCQENRSLVDRTGARFPVIKAPGCRNEILNSKVLFLADRQQDYCRLGLWATRLRFTVETAQQCVQVLQRYCGQGRWAPEELTRGLYYREVE
ncbi:MAG: U32 family peptidase [Oscillospiraceae bacterium]|nr:U32 family peptidase [Oscillospiraceae bacterium]